MGLNEDSDDRSHTEHDKGRSGNFQVRRTKTTANSELRKDVIAKPPRHFDTTSQSVSCSRVQLLSLQHIRAKYSFKVYLVVWLFTTGLSSLPLCYDAFLCIATFCFCSHCSNFFYSFTPINCLPPSPKRFKALPRVLK
jgi:hypothetical protein